MILKQLPKTRTSHPFSKLLRPVFETKRIKTAFGGMISAAGLASGLVLLPTDQTIASNVQPFTQQVEFETQKSFANVLPEYTGISQKFHMGHPGIDITASLGAKIFPVKEGVVIRVDNMKWNYGRAVYIDHGNDTISLYAHMGKIFVEEGEKVNTEKPIGEVGLTGRTTGPHLHLEIRKNESMINPQPYLAFGPVNKR